LDMSRKRSYHTKNIAIAYNVMTWMRWPSEQFKKTSDGIYRRDAAQQK
jgi:hypothetical protein